MPSPSAPAPHPDATPGIYRHFECQTRLPGVSGEAEWDLVSSWAGINHELGPWLRMRVPHGHETIMDLASSGEDRAVSWICLFGILPVERHVLGLKSLTPPTGFDERSHNLLMAVWLHRRTLVPADNGVTIADQCAFVPRLAFLAPVMLWIYRRVFFHRHRRLAKQALEISRKTSDIDRDGPR